MARTKYLSGEELNKLREAIRQKFRVRNPRLKPIPATTYKEAYDDLREDIISVVPEAEQSVSLTRLRKLFYYTDPNACDPAQLENASFGKDFLAALDIYVAGNTGNKPVRFVRRYGFYSVGLALSLLLGIVLWVNLHHPEKSDWSESFNDLHLNRLKREGWEIRDFDSLFWCKQPRPGMLALYTLPGDYWVKPKEPRQVTNLLIHPLNGDKLDISTRLIDFYPTQNHQQAGFILLNENKSRVQHLRVAYGFAGLFQDKQNRISATPPAGNWELTVLQMNETGHVFMHPFPLCSVPAAIQPTGMDTVYLYLSIRGNKCSVNIKSGLPWNQYRQLTSVELDFKPAYLGLAAFQGWTRDDSTPKGADTIPAYFDWVQVKSIK